jgi:hypothetical protein
LRRLLVASHESHFPFRSAKGQSSPSIISEAGESIEDEASRAEELKLEKKLIFAKNAFAQLFSLQVEIFDPFRGCGEEEEPRRKLSRFSCLLSTTRFVSTQSQMCAYSLAAYHVRARLCRPVVRRNVFCFRSTSQVYVQQRSSFN